MSEQGTPARPLDSPGMSKRLGAILRTVAGVLAAAAVSLAPIYGKQHWFVFLVAASSLLSLLAPSLLGSSSTSSSTTPAGRGPGGTLSAGGR